MRTSLPRRTYPEATKEEPWFEIVGMVGDTGMTPTDLGEAPYLFTPASLATTSPLVVAVRVEGDPEALVGRVRTIAANLDAGMRLDELALARKRGRSVPS